MGRAHYKLCDRLKLEKKQRRMCRRDPGVAETLREAITMSALECQYQFRFERWNCTLEGRHRANILKRGTGSRIFQILLSEDEKIAHRAIHWLVLKATICNYQPNIQIPSFPLTRYQVVFRYIAKTMQGAHKCIPNVLITLITQISENTIIKFCE